MDNQLYDINTVCKMLGVTSRTLRFWEEKGLISGTKALSGRRQYTIEQIDAIKRVIALRTIGLSVKTVQELQNNELELRAAINERRAAAYAAIEKKQREISVLCEALAILNNGDDLYTASLPLSTVMDGKCKDIAEKCAAAVVYNNESTLYSFFSDKMKAYLPIEVYKKVRADCLEPLGEFVEFDKLVTDERFKNIFLQYVKYEKLGLIIKLVFYGEKLEGLWLSYYEI